MIEPLVAEVETTLASGNGHTDPAQVRLALNERHQEMVAQTATGCPRRSRGRASAAPPSRISATCSA
jgi:hypothetical protein